MLRSMITATNTLNQLQQQLDAIGHNLANIDTNGYKKMSTTFHELMRQELNNQPDLQKETGRLTDYGLRLGVGARLDKQLVFHQGAIKTTGRELDVALLHKDQFLQVEVDGEVRYTRDGALYLSPANDGTNRLMLVTKDGYRVLDENQNPIYLDGDIRDIVISANGTLTAASRNEGELPQTVNLGVVRVDRPSMMISLGNNIYGLQQLGNVPITDVLTNLEGDLRTEIGMRQGALESSNVDLTQEITDLMIAQRSYQLNARSITIGDQMLGLINTVR
ncbi:flagellar hook-basal body protein [Aeribacillus composti]|jgi:fagellar hook-basal body proteins|uniref:flagellar hook-basal body protein n=1 Tax=Aeribacillus composti TaxID=1868734 RepID=UPI002E1D3B02|nr:flagellar hook-basal body protein [Aeribacillus composti]